MTFLFFVDENGGLHHVFIAAITAVVSIAVSFAVTRVILTRDLQKK